MHPNHFFRFFKDKTVHFPAKYIKMLKMEIARRYLEETEMPVSKIIEEIGDDDFCISPSLKLKKTSPPKKLLLLPLQT